MLTGGQGSEVTGVGAHLGGEVTCLKLRGKSGSSVSVGCGGVELRCCQPCSDYRNRGLSLNTLSCTIYVFMMTTLKLESITMPFR